ncbi:growth/differentiation factor 8-like [Oratosquilla oratoria]|uniref:growth/differentiation factor 8-like n=1 Tax=Oratosquilla oratoria TaxID=337810 RepID=UPI003F776C5E
MSRINYYGFGCVTETTPAAYHAYPKCQCRSHSHTYLHNLAPEGLQAPPNTEILYFNLSDSLRTLQVRKALLHLWLKPVFKEHHSKIPITIYKVLKPEYPEDYIRQKEISTVYETVYPHRGTWIKIDLYKLVRQWFENPDENQGVVVQATDTQIIQLSESRSYAPVLEIHTRESRRSRSKRMANRVCRDDSQESLCCRYPLTVDFVKLGWDFIVAPKSYDANFCRGECPYLYAHKYVHTSMLQKINQNGTTGPCCGARQLSAVQMLYYDHTKNVKLDIIQDMIVDRCGCN